MFWTKTLLRFLPTPGPGHGHLVLQVAMLVLSNSDMPWLFDMEKHPNELINYYGRAE